MNRRSMPAALEATRNRKTLALAEIVQAYWIQSPKKLLVVGCGTGEEAGFLARHFNIDTTGIDIGNEFAFDREGATPALLQIMDAHSLSFADNSFDFVYSFHALEHMANPQLALNEMARVLRKGGTFVIGTPNKSRLMGYIGSATPLSNKIKWNVNDWVSRLRGQWRNETGAHAGFTENELLVMCASAFQVQPASVSHSYYSALYGKRFVQKLIQLRITRWIYPCVYVVGTRQR